MSVILDNHEGSPRSHPGSKRAYDFSSSPMLVYWEMTQACGLSCRHCRAEAVLQRHPHELNGVESRALLRQIAAFGEPRPHLVLTGGDPLRRPDLYDLIDEAVALGLEVSITPAVTPLLTRQVMVQLKAHGIQSIGLSLDGSCAERHEAVRGVPGCFDWTMDAIRYAAEVELPIQINTLVAAETADDLSAIYELLVKQNASYSTTHHHARGTLAKSVGDGDASSLQKLTRLISRCDDDASVMARQRTRADGATRTASAPIMRWSLFFLIAVGRGRMLEPVSPARGEEIMNWTLDLARRAPFAIKTTEAPSYRRLALERMRAQGMTTEAIRLTSVYRGFGIRDGHGILFVSHTGDIYPAGFLPLTVGNIRTDALVDVYRHSPTFRALHNPNTFKGKCGYCEYRFICGGSRARAFAHTGDPLESDPFCPYQPKTEYVKREM